MTIEQGTPNMEIRIIEVGNCQSLSGRTMLDFQVGCNEQDEIFLRVLRTSGNGFFSKEWVPYDSITPLLVNPLTSASLRPIFHGKSVNTSGFLLAVLKYLGLVQAIPKELRGYQIIESTVFIDRARKSILEGVAISPVSPDANNKKLTIKAKKKNPKPVI